MQQTRTVAQTEIDEKWYHIDAQGKRLGHVATIAAELLLDKGNPKMRDYLSPRSKVVITNASGLDVTDRKRKNKLYTRYSGYPSGLTTETLGDLMDKFPERVIEKAVKRMLPKNRRGRAIFANNLYVYAGDDHKHEAQKPQTIDVNEIKL